MQITTLRQLEQLFAVDDSGSVRITLSSPNERTIYINYFQRWTETWQSIRKVVENLKVAQIVTIWWVTHPKKELIAELILRPQTVLDYIDSLAPQQPQPLLPAPAPITQAARPTAQEVCEVIAGGSVDALIRLWPKCDIPTFDAAYQALMELAETKPKAYWHMCLVIADIYRDDCRASFRISELKQQPITSKLGLFRWALHQYDQQTLANTSCVIRQFDIFMKSRALPTMINTMDWGSDSVRVLLGMTWFVASAQ